MQRARGRSGHAENVAATPPALSTDAAHGRTSAINDRLATTCPLGPMIGAEGYMPTREDMLAKQTHKEEGTDVGRRIFYTLSEDREKTRDMMQVHRNSKAIAMLFKTLLEAGTITEDQLDDILLEVVT